MIRALISITLVCMLAGTLYGQTTAFSHQGKLNDNGAPANGNYDFEFELFDAVSGGAQQGATVQRLNVAVVNGIFTVSLDFGAAVLPGADRFLDIAVRTAGGGAFTPLTPRQRMTSVPYAIRSLNASSADTVVVAGVPAGSGNYIQNTSSPQAASNFNISGTGTANAFTATTQYNIGVNRILSNPGTTNTFVGVSTGTGLTTGSGNSVFGHEAGPFIGSGQANSFFGLGAGFNTNNGNQNSFFGRGAGSGTTTGSNNVFAGFFSGSANTIGANNTLLGTSTNLGANNLVNAAAIGANARVDSNNSLVLGSINGVNNATADTNVGIGTTAPAYKLDVVGRTRFKQNTGQTGAINSAGFWLFQNTPNAEQAFVGMENDNSVGFFGNNGGGWGLVMNTQTGVTTINALGTAGGTTLCRNASNQISTCSSSLRYKTNIDEFSQGMSFVNKLRPITFDWKDGGMKDVGFGAEDIAKIDPRFVTFNDKGEVEGVKYDRLSVAFVNAFKEQQTEISELRAVTSEQAKKIKDQNSKIEDQQAQIDALKELVCPLSPTAAVCKR